MLSRIEYMFLKHKGLPLGVFQALPEVEKTMAKYRRDEKLCRVVFDTMRNRNMQIMFPGIGLKQIYNDMKLEDTGIAREIARNLRGIIPPEGIYIGDSPKKPQQSRPALVPYPSGKTPFPAS